MRHESALDAVSQVIRKALPGVRVSGIPFSSGALSLEVVGEGHHAAVDVTPSGEWGVSVDPPDEEGFFGHDQVLTSLDEVVGLLRVSGFVRDLGRPTPGNA